MNETRAESSVVAGEQPAEHADQPGPAENEGVRARAGSALSRVARRIARTFLKYGVAVAISVAGGFVAVALYAEYGYHPIQNAATWAEQPLQYAIETGCAACHGSQVATVAADAHATVDCQACHGPRAEHVLSRGAAAAGSSPIGSVALALPASASTTAEREASVESICLACHERVLGRRAGFPVVGATSHFGGAVCTLCHEPHSSVPLEPPGVRHPLKNLPDCVVCHGAGGIRPVPERHPDYPDADCFTCHSRVRS